jgi:predicted RNase H-like HicB family nuclease
MGGKKVFKYPVIIEKANGNYSAYSPDLPGCVSTGATIEETLSRMRDAIQFHIEGLKKEGLDIPEPSTKVEYIEISI